MIYEESDIDVNKLFSLIVNREVLIEEEVKIKLKNIFDFIKKNEEKGNGIENDFYFLDRKKVRLNLKYDFDFIKGKEDLEFFDMED